MFWFELLYSFAEENMLLALVGKKKRSSIYQLGNAERKGVKVSSRLTLGRGGGGKEKNPAGRVEASG